MDVLVLEFQDGKIQVSTNKSASGKTTYKDVGSAENAGSNFLPQQIKVR